MIFQPGVLLLNGKYRVEAFIGQGASAEVYRAQHLALKLPRALKVLRKGESGVGSSDYADYRQRFQLEAQLGAKINNPHVVRVYDFDEEGELLVLAMEYAVGGSLVDRLARLRGRNERMPVEEAVGIALDVATGLAAIHDQDAVHRDLKPSNILFDANGRAKVADLGLAQVPGGPSMRSRLSTAAPHPGTLEYMSPEQESSSVFLRPNSDVYALGLILFEMLTGRTHKAVRPGTRAKSLRADVSHLLDDLISRMLADDPKARPFDGAQVADALHATGVAPAYNPDEVWLRERAAAESAALITAQEQMRRKSEYERRAKELAEQQAREEAARREVEEQAKHRADEDHTARLREEQKQQAEAERLTAASLTSKQIILEPSQDTNLVQQEQPAVRRSRLSSSRSVIAFVALLGIMIIGVVVTFSLYRQVPMAPIGQTASVPTAKPTEAQTLDTTTLAVVISTNTLSTPPTSTPTAIQTPTETPTPVLPTLKPTSEPVEESRASAISSDELTRGKTLILDIDGGKVSSPDLWNPFLPGGRRDHGFHQAMMEPLFILNYMNGEINPWLGESMTANAKQDVWTLRLNADATWNDGTPVTSDDVVFSINLCKNTTELTCYSSTSGWVQDVKKIDDKTVEITLTRPNPRYQLDNWSVKIWGNQNIVPKHIWEGQDPLTFKNYEEGKSPVFSGPYRLVSFNADGTEFIYERDDNWWGAKSGFKPLPAPERLIWTWAGPPENRIALIASKKLDSLMDITLGGFKTLQERNPNVIAWYKNLPYVVLDPCSRTFEFNTTLAPWDDPEMRWAVNYAIDRDQIVQIAYEGTTTKSRIPHPMYPPIERFDKLAETAGLYKKYPIWTHDPAKAQEIIKSKGYTMGTGGYYAKDGKQLSMVITTHEAFIEFQRIADVIVEQLQNVGINASRKNEAGQLWGNNLALGMFEAHMGWQNCGSVNEPWATLDTLNSRWLEPVGTRASSNGFRWNNTTFSKAVDEMGVLPLGDPKIDNLFLVAYEEYLKELPTIPITQARKLIPFDTTYWINWPTADNAYAAPWTWWQSFYDILVSLKPRE